MDAHGCRCILTPVIPPQLFLIPTPLIVVTGFAAIAFAWSVYARRRLEQWPAVQGTIEEAWAESGRGNRSTETCGVRIKYTYAYEGATYAGEYRQPFNDEDAAHEFAFGLKGRNVLVHVDPEKPKRSGLLARDVASVVSERGAVPEGALPPAPPLKVSPGRKLLAVPFAAIALAGFVAAVAINVAGWMGKIIFPSFMFATMHIGVFIVFLPAILLGARRRKGYSLNSGLQVGAQWPTWAKRFALIVFVYAIANFGFFLVQAGNQKKHGPITALMWRGFSGHWMVFYLFSLGLLYAVITAPSDKARCVNGHEMRGDSLVCPACGAGRELSS